MAQENQKETKTAFDYKNQSDEFWKTHLIPETYKVCRVYGTERAGSGMYDKFYEEGTYYCACCGGITLFIVQRLNLILAQDGQAFMNLYQMLL